jgi:5-methylcytosine-specific restriction endonuclease McrA
MAQRYLEAEKVELPSSAPQFVEPGHCLWCNRPLTGKAKRYCSLKMFPELNPRYYTDSPCYIHFYNYFYARPAYQRAVLIRDNFTCQKCELHPMREDKPWLPDLSRLHVDHIIPVSRGGTSELKNLQVLCDKCNLKKGDKAPGEMTRAEAGMDDKNVKYPPGKCPQCRNTTFYVVKYDPDDGYDPMLKKCVCRRCGFTYYLAPIHYQEVLL